MDSKPTRFFHYGFRHLTKGPSCEQTDIICVAIEQYQLNTNGIIKFIGEGIRTVLESNDSLNVELVLRNALAAIGLSHPKYGFITSEISLEKNVEHLNEIIEENEWKIIKRNGKALANHSTSYKSKYVSVQIKIDSFPFFYGYLKTTNYIKHAIMFNLIPDETTHLCFNIDFSMPITRIHSYAISTIDKEKSCLITVCYVVLPDTEINSLLESFPIKWIGKDIDKTRNICFKASDIEILYNDFIVDFVDYLFKDTVSKLYNNSSCQLILKQDRMISNLSSVL
jgi:hypothetical protein